MALILLAEDNRVIAEIMRVRLVAAGHEVVWAADGREALDQLAELRPQLILLDMMMPEIDGAELLQRIKGDPMLGAIPVLVVSARSQEEDILSALAAGAVDYVTKPISLRELLARVDRALARGPQPLRVTVRSSEDPGAVAVGEIVEFEPRRLTLRFHGDSAPCHAIGDRVDVSLGSRTPEEVVGLTARIDARAETEQHRVYTLLIDRRSRVTRERAAAFLDAIGGRSQYRVPLADDDPPVEVAVLVQSGGTSHQLQGTLEDLSIGGARVRFKADAEQVLHRVDRFELRMQLPGDDEALGLTADIRHRSAASGDVCYRLRFDPEGSPDFVEQQERISSFVLSRSR